MTEMTGLFFTKWSTLILINKVRCVYTQYTQYLGRLSMWKVEAVVSINDAPDSFSLF